MPHCHKCGAHYYGDKRNHRCVSEDSVSSDIPFSPIPDFYDSPPISPINDEPKFDYGGGSGGGAGADDSWGGSDSSSSDSGSSDGGSSSD